MITASNRLVGRRAMRRAATRDEQQQLPAVAAAAVVAAASAARVGRGGGVGRDEARSAQHDAEAHHHPLLARRHDRARLAAPPERVMTVSAGW